MSKKIYEAIKELSSQKEINLKLKGKDRKIGHNILRKKKERLKIKSGILKNPDYLTIPNRLPKFRLSALACKMMQTFNISFEITSIKFSFNI